MKALVIDAVELFDIVALMVGRVALLGAVVAWLFCLALLSADAVDDYRRGRTIRKGSK